jgi:hypothetical protein
MDEGNDEFDLAKYFYLNFRSEIIHAVKFYEMRLWLFLPSSYGRHAADLYRP